MQNLVLVNADGSDALYISTFSIDSNAIDNSEDLPTPPTHEWNFRRNVSAVYLSDAFNTQERRIYEQYGTIEL